MSAAVPLHSHWRDIYARRWIVLATALAAGLLAWLISTAITPIYESKSTFYLASNAPPPGFTGAGGDSPPEPLFPTADEKSASLNVGILRGRDMFAALARVEGGDISTLQRRVDITVSGEFMVDVFARDPDAQRAMRLANLVPAQYAAFHEASMAARAQDRADALTAHLALLQNEARELRAAGNAQARDLGGPVDRAMVARLTAARVQADQAVTSVRAEIDATTARIAELQAAVAREAVSYTSGSTALTTPVLDMMVEQLLALRVDLAAVTDGPLSPRRTAIQQQMDEIGGSIEEERKRLATATTKLSGSLYEELRLELATSGAALAGLQARLNAATAQAAVARAALSDGLDVLAQREEADQRLARLSAQIAGVESNLSSAQVQATNAKAPLVMVERAIATTRAAFPIPVLNVIVAVITGLILGCYYALFLGHAARARVARVAGGATLPVFTAIELAEIRALAAEAKGAGHG